MNWTYDFFQGKDNLTEDDIAEFEAHAELMQDRDLAIFDREEEERSSYV